MPKLKAVLDSLDGIDQDLQGYYTRGADERFYLDLEGIDGHPAVLPVIRKKNELLEELKAAKEKLRAYDGIEDPEAAREALRRLPDLEAQVQKGGKGAEEIQKLQRDYEAKLEAVKRQAQADIEAAKQKAQAAEDAAMRYFRRSEIHRAITAHKGVPELLEHVVSGFVKVERTESGDFKLSILDHNGVERIKDAKGTPFTLDDLIAELKENPKYGRAFDATGRSGSGAEAAAGGGGGGVQTVRAEGGMVKADPAKVLSGEIKVVA